MIRALAPNSLNTLSFCCLKQVFAGSVFGMLDELASALDGLAATDLDLLTDPELHDRVVGLRGEVSRLQSIVSATVSAWDARHVWAGDGSKTPSARLGRDCRLSPEAAHREVRRARSLRGMPATAAAFAAGTISSDHVDALRSVATPEFAGLFARDEQMLVEFALTLSFRRFRRALSYWRFRADTERGERQAARSPQWQCYPVCTPTPVTPGRVHWGTGRPPFLGPIGAPCSSVRKKEWVGNCGHPSGESSHSSRRP